MFLSKQVNVYMHNAYHECGRKLFAAASHHVMQNHWVLGDVYMNIANGDECAVLGLGLAGQTGVQALALANGHSHHCPE